MLVEAQERAEREGTSSGPAAPPMSTWSAEIEALTTIADKIGTLNYIMRAVNGDKTSQPPRPAMRPKTLLESIKAKRRQKRHVKLADRLLGR